MLHRIGVGAALAQEDLETSEDDLLVARAGLEKARAGFRETAQKPDRFVVRAPIRGTILQVNLRAGEHAAPGGSTVPIALGSIDDLQVRADVDEQLAPRVRSGARAMAYRKGETQRANADAASETTALSLARYTQGLVTYLEVVESQREGYSPAARSCRPRASGSRPR